MEHSGIAHTPYGSSVTLALAQQGDMGTGPNWARVSTPSVHLPSGGAADPPHICSRNNHCQSSFHEGKKDKTLSQPLVSADYTFCEYF